MERTSGQLLVEARRLKEQERTEKQNQRRLKNINTFSKLVMALVMLMFFIGVAVAVHSVLFQGEHVSVLLDYIAKFALPAMLGYLIKAFGENVAKIVISAAFGVKNINFGDKGEG